MNVLKAKKDTEVSLSDSSHSDTSRSKLSTDHRLGDTLIKIILVGDPVAGKSALFDRYTENDYKDIYSTTIGIDFRTKTVILNSNICRLHIWDTAGHERFRTITQYYYRGSNICLLCLDINRDLEELLVSIDSWANELINRCGNNVAFYVVGMKSDIKRNTDNKLSLVAKHAITKKFKFIGVCSSKLNSFHPIDYDFETDIDWMFNFVLRDYTELYVDTGLVDINMRKTKPVKLTKTTSCCEIN